MAVNRRNFVLGTLGVGALLVGVGAWLRPGDRGGPYSEYFRALNNELKAKGPMRPVLLIDLDRTRLASGGAPSRRGAAVPGGR